MITNDPSAQLQLINATTQPAIQIDTPTLQEQCKLLMNSDFKKEFTSAIIARDRWEKLNTSLEVASHIFQGTTTILAFISAAIKVPALSIVAGCTGVCTTVFMAYSQNCKTKYKNETKKIEDMSNKINIQPILPDESSEMNNSDTPRTRQARHLLTAYHQHLSTPTTRMPGVCTSELPTQVVTPTNSPSPYLSY